MFKRIALSFIATVAFCLLVWVLIPGQIPVQFQLWGWKVDTVIAPPVITYERDGVPVVKDFRTRLGLDLEGGSHLVFEADTSQIRTPDITDAVESARNIIERRVNMFGVSEPVVQTVKSGDRYRISVDLPGVQDVAQATRLIGQTAQLTFRTTASSEASLAVASAEAAIFGPYTGKTDLTGADVKKASVTFDPNTGQPQVLLAFTPEGAKKFEVITRENLNKQVAIFLDNGLLSDPEVQSVIADGNAVISGSFPLEMAKELAVAINSGALPLPIQLVEQRSIGPSLGQEEVQKSMVAGGVGLTLVLVFMISLYGWLGVIAGMSLLLYGMITLAIFKSIPIVLTLPGLAGFILSIGMAVDANILIFERIKEELRRGRTRKAAIRIGFGRAIDAIKDANITTLLVSFILFNPLNWEWLPQFGLVRGFAVTLAIGVMTSLFTGVFITKYLVTALYPKK